MPGVSRAAQSAVDEIAAVIFPLLREGRCNSDCKNCNVFTKCAIAEGNTKRTMMEIIEKRVRPLTEGSEQAIQMLQAMHTILYMDKYAEAFAELQWRASRGPLECEQIGEDEK